MKDDRTKCREEFLATALEDNPMNWYIWKRAWEASKVEHKKNYDFIDASLDCLNNPE